MCNGFDYFVDIHIQVDGSLSVAEGHAIAHAVKDKLLKSDLRIKDVLVHVEPVTVSKTGTPNNATPS
jgi:divalent metal cation (Fe/Co/Zn/Cd) transporter